MKQLTDGNLLLQLCKTPPSKMKDRLFTSKEAKYFAGLNDDGSNEHDFSRYGQNYCGIQKY